MSASFKQEKKVFLRPGEFFFSDLPSVVTTVLGSCVSVTMFSAEHHSGAICHALLPEEKDAGDACRYVDSSIMKMLRAFSRNGIDHSRIEVKLFGGSDVLPVVDVGKQGTTVGRQNIDAALRVIERERLNIAASDLGGVRGRKILFHTHTGEILLKRLNRIERP
jgi:chemotaxis protein CheD